MKPKSYRYRVGFQSVVIHHCAKGWRFEVPGVDGKRRYVTRRKKAKIEKAADDLFQGKEVVVWEGVPEKRRGFLVQVNELVPAGAEADVLEYLRHRTASATVAQAVDRFYESMALRGRSARHVKALKMDLDAFSKIVGGTVADVTVETLRGFLQVRCEGVGLARRKQVRGTLVQFFRWCRKEALVSNDTVTAADRLPSISLPAGERRVMTRGEFAKCWRLLPPRHKAWFLLGAWAGLRPEEAAPTATKLADGRRGVSWEDIDWEFNHIRISAETAKVDRPRIVPMCEALRAALLPLRGTGAICAASPVRDKTLRMLGEKVFKGAWPADVLRHSYGSYRNALVRNLPQVAEEMGTSVDMLHRHYHNPRAMDEALTWFSAVDESEEELCESYAI